jgi:hypothetical protein
MTQVPCGHHPLGEGQADRGGDALPQRPGGRLDRRMPAQIGVRGGRRVQMAEALQRRDAHAGMAGEMQQCVQQQRAMPGGEHEAVAVRPVRVGGIKFVEAGPQRGGRICHAQRQAVMAGPGFCHRIERQRTNGVGHAALGRGGAGQDGGLQSHGRMTCGCLGRGGHVTS